MGAIWRKSSRSSGAENCVEIALPSGHSAVRDSKNPTGPTLAFSRTAFGAFLDDMRHDEAN
jgi:hypothetical protein